MALAGPRKPLAVDTNLALNLAKGAEFAHDFVEIFLERGYAFRLPPTVAAELNFFYRAGTSLQKELAQAALLNIRKWGIQPLDLSDVELGIAEQFARKLLLSGLLPPGEVNDALILAETSIAQIPVLVTSDKHLLDMDENRLLALLKDAELSPVQAAHPRRLLGALF